MCDAPEIRFYHSLFVLDLSYYCVEGPTRPPQLSSCNLRVLKRVVGLLVFEVPMVKLKDLVRFHRRDGVSLLGYSCLTFIYRQTNRLITRQNYGKERTRLSNIRDFIFPSHILLGPISLPSYCPPFFLKFWEVFRKSWHWFTITNFYRVIKSFGNHHGVISSKIKISLYKLNLLVWSTTEVLFERIERVRLKLRFSSR